MDVRENDVVQLRHSFYMNAYWLVKKIMPSLKEGVNLYRMQLLQADGVERSAIRPITITKQLIKKNLGGYDQWLLQSKN